MAQHVFVCDDVLRNLMVLVSLVRVWKARLEHPYTAHLRDRRQASPSTSDIGTYLQYKCSNNNKKDIFKLTSFKELNAVVGSLTSLFWAAPIPGSHLSQLFYAISVQPTICRANFHAL